MFSGTVDKLEDVSGTIDNIAPDPIETVSITQKQGSNYIYEVVFNDEGSYRVAVTCESNLDDPAVDDDIRFISGVSVRTGLIDGVSVDLGFPSFHLNTSTDCSGCHTLGAHYDISVVNHDYVVGVCQDCNF